MRPHPPPPRLRARTGLVLLALAVSVFSLLALDLIWHGPITAADAGISNWFHQHNRPLLTWLLLAVTYLHGTGSIYVMAALAALWLVRTRQSSWLPSLLLSVPGGLILNALVKQTFQRTRPSFDAPVFTATGSYSFPSGHAAGATVFWGFALVLLLAHQPRLRWRVAGTVVAVAMVALTALSRVYLGAHYPSDVLAAIAEGVAWLALCFTVPVLWAPHQHGRSAADG
jgi:membrane-associated phospholipid phosphatase